MARKTDLNLVKIDVGLLQRRLKKELKKDNFMGEASVTHTGGSGIRIAIGSPSFYNLGCLTSEFPALLSMIVEDIEEHVATVSRQEIGIPS